MSGQSDEEAKERQRHEELKWWRTFIDGMIFGIVLILMVWLLSLVLPA